MGACTQSAPARVCLKELHRCTAEASLCVPPRKSPLRGSIAAGTAGLRRTLLHARDRGGERAVVHARREDHIGVGGVVPGALQQQAVLAECGRRGAG